MERQSDYVIIGGGSAGCVLAGRLTKDANVSVTLLEAGGVGDDWLVNTPAAVVAMVPRAVHNWAFETVPQPGLGGRCGYQPRGKVLGGSSSINAMVYIRGHRSDYDLWAAMGNHGWSYDEVLPYFKRAEDNPDFQDNWHGQGGPLPVSHLRTDNPFQQYYLQAATEVGFPINKDFNGAQQEGLGIYQVTQRDGERWSAYRAYLKPHVSRQNLHIETRSHVTRILLLGGRAVGVEFRQGDRAHRIMARREVILCAGALQSPQILMLSGIGDAEHLQSHGIAVNHHLPGVGKNLQDHPDFIFGFQSGSSDLLGLSLRGGWHLLRQLMRYRRERRGLLTSNFAEAGGFLKTNPELAAPNIQLHFVVALVDDHARTLHAGHGFSCHVCLLRPKSVGSVSLRDANSLSSPHIDPKFLDHQDDVDNLVAGFKMTQRLMQAPALAKYITGDLFTASVHTDDDIRQILKQRVDTIYHPVGTCRMGADTQAVVDACLRVHGIKGLRVVDASIMPTLIGGNTHAPVVMIAEKAADMIRADSKA